MIDLCIEKNQKSRLQIPSAYYTKGVLYLVKYGIFDLPWLFSILTFLKRYNYCVYPFIDWIYFESFILFSRTIHLYSVTGIRCIVHLLQLAVEDFFEVIGSKTKKFISRARNIVKKCRSSNLRNALKREKCTYLSLDVSTRLVSLK